MNMTETLKPCPFCGESLGEVCTNDCDWWWTRCEGCGGETLAVVGSTRSDAVKDWNTRPTEDALYEALAALVAAHQSPRFEDDIAEALTDAERAMKRARGEDPGPRAPRQEPEPYNPYRL